MGTIHLYFKHGYVALSLTTIILSWFNLPGRLIAGSLFLAVSYSLIKNRFSENKKISSILTLLVSIILPGVVFFYLFNIGTISFIFTIASITTLALTAKQPTFKPRRITMRMESIPLWMFSIATIDIIRDNAITISTNSPWLHIPSLFWVFLAITVCGFGITVYTQTTKIHHLILLFFVFASIAFFAYPIGYGFDPFIHRATIQYIAEHGTISPKPLFYVGQYTLELFLHGLTGIDTSIIDRILVPLLFSILIPLSLTAALKKKSYILMLSALALLLPFIDVIATTPQGLANTLFLAMIIISFAHISRALFVTLGIAITFIHPLTGIPALFFIMLKAFHESWFPSISTQGTRWLLIASGGLALPIAFSASTFLHPEILSQALALEKLTPRIIESLKQLSIFIPRFPEAYELIPSISYVYVYNIRALILIAGIFAIYQLHKKNTIKPITDLLILLISAYFLVTILIPFDFLIEYERGNYGMRILNLITMVFVPAIILMLANYTEKKRTSCFHAWFITIILAISLLGSLYATLPRHTRYETSRSYTIGQVDLDTVSQIETHAKEQDYVVLSNQNVAASALETFGFKKYYPHTDHTGEQIYLYPIPTGGSLYQVYLSMVYDAPTKENARKAFEITGVNNVYFVMNPYWSDFEKIVNNAIAHADEMFQVGKNVIFLYRY